MGPLPRVFAAGLLPFAAFLAAFGASSCVNPFAPRLDTAPPQAPCDLRTLDCIFERFQNAYTLRDTTVYGPLLSPDFIFVYRNYEFNIDVTWGRDDEMRSTYRLYTEVPRLDLIWNNITSRTETDTTASIERGFSLTVTFNPNDIESVYGYADLVFRRPSKNDPWTITQWRDKSNF